MNIEKFIERKIPGINVLRMSSSSYLPGSIINTRKDDIRVGHAKDIFKNEKKNYWAIDYLEANILLEESLTGKTKLGANGNFLGIFNLKAGVKSSYDISYSIDSITCCELKTASQIELEMKIAEFEKSNKDQWKKIKGLTILTSSYFAKSFTLTFKRSGKVNAEVEIKNEIDINAGVDVTWKNDGKLIIAANEKVPFGVRGFVIR